MNTKVTPLKAKEPFDIVLNEQLTQIVIEEVCQDAKQKTEEVAMLESSLLKKRRVLNKLKSRQSALQVALKKKEDMISKLHALSEQLLEHELHNPNTILNLVDEILN